MDPGICGFSSRQRFRVAGFRLRISPIPSIPWPSGASSPSHSVLSPLRNISKAYMIGEVYMTEMKL